MIREQEIQLASNQPEKIAVEVPASLLREAEAALSEYGEYDSTYNRCGSLVALIDLVGATGNDRSHNTWKIRVQFQHAPKDLLANLDGMVPSALYNSLQLEKGGIFCRVAYERLGVAQTATMELAEALADLGCQDITVESISPLGATKGPPSNTFVDAPSTEDSAPTAGSQVPPPAPEGASTAGAPHPDQRKQG